MLCVRKACLKLLSYIGTAKNTVTSMTHVAILHMTNCDFCEVTFVLECEVRVPQSPELRGVSCLPELTAIIH